MKRKIFVNDFSPYYPVGIKPCPMYVDVANRIFDKINKVEINLPCAADLKKEIAVNAAIYYEDKMSGIGLWNAFVARYQLTYNQSLPFFDDENPLAKGDVNFEEIKLLIWLVLSRNFKDRFLNPLVMGEYMANVIMNVLTEDDEVEVNDGLYNYIYDIDKANDYFKLKHVLIWLRRSYLLCSPLSDAIFDEFTDNFSDLCSKSESIYYAETTFLMHSEIGPMAIEPHLCLADMYYERHMLNEAEKLVNLKYCQQDIFVVTDISSEYVILKDSKDEEYKVKNLDHDVFSKVLYVCTALVKYADNDWEINGFLLEMNKDDYYRRHEQMDRLAVSYKHAYSLYMERTKGKRLAFFENTNQLQDWLKVITPEMDISANIHELPSGAQVAFISKKAGIVFAPKMNHAIKCKDNPYYKQCDTRTMQKETMEAVINIEAMHPELLHYLLENNMLQDGDISNMYQCELGNEIFTRHIDFIARNHRRHYYHDHDY